MRKIKPKPYYSSLIVLLLGLFIIPLALSGQGVVITESTEKSEPHESAIFEIRSDGKGILIPRLTSAERTAIANPANGLLVFDTDENQFFFYDNTTKDGKGGWVMSVGPEGPPGTTLWHDYPNDNMIYTESMVSIGVKEAISSSLVIGPVVGLKETDPLFEVTNESGEPVFSIYKDRVEIIIDDSEKTRGGFAVSGRTGSKVIRDLFVVSPDETRVFIDDSQEKTRGGFAVSGRTGSKESLNNFFQVTPRLTEVIVDESSSKTRGGFAVSGRTGSKAAAAFMYLTPENYLIGHESGEAISSGLYNSFLGYNAGKATTDGDENIFIGYMAGLLNTAGNQNTFVGTSAGLRPLMGSQNVFIGFEAGKYHNAGNDNVFLGNSAGMSSNTYSEVSSRNVILGISAGKMLREAIDNVFIGHKAGEGFGSGGVTGDYNVIIGERAGNSISSGSSNIFLGTQAGFENTGGNNNVFLGYRAGMKNKTANSNIAIGHDAARENESGAANVLIGHNVASLGKIGNWNILIGHNTASSADFTGAMNVMIGSDVGTRLTSAQRNVFIGDLVGVFNTTGSGNVFMGANAGYNNTTADNNIFIGTNSGNANTSGENNVFSGFRSGTKNTTGYSNVMLGDSVGASNTSGYRNVFIGHLAGKSNTTGRENIYIGYQAGLNATNSGQSVIIGNYAGMSLTFGGGQSLMIGDHAGKNNTSGSRNTFVGFFSGRDNVTGDYNAFFGQFAGQENTGDNNTYIGYWAGGWNTDGGNNTFVGMRSGLGASVPYSSSNNVYLGHEAGAYNTGSNNVMLGFEAGRSTGAASNRLYIANSQNNTLIYGQFDNKRVGIDNTNPTATLDINGTIRIRGGAPGANKVLTSDADGIGSWTDLGSLPGSSRWTESGSNIYRSSGNVGIGTTAIPAKFTVAGSAALPAIPGSASNGILRISSGMNEGLDIGKAGNAGNYAAWLQSGYNGSADPLVLQPEGGNLGVGVIQPNHTLTVLSGVNADPSGTGIGIVNNSNANFWNLHMSTAFFRFSYNGTNVSYINNTTGAYIETSDKRLKENINPAPSLLNRVMQLDIVEYNFIRSADRKRNIGLLAQEALKHFPEFVSYEDNGEDSYYGINYSGFSVVAIKAIQEQQEIIDNQTKIIDDLQARIERLEKMIMEK